MPYGFESRSFDNDGALLVLPRPTNGVPSNQTQFVDGWAIDSASGCSYVEFVGSSVPSSAQVTKWGRVTTDGALCVTPETSPRSGDYVHQSIRYRNDGAMYVAINGTANSASDQQTRLGRLTRTGAMYLAAISFLVDFTDSGSGAVNTGVSFGGVAATFTRATPATTYLANRTVGNVSTGVARSYYLPDGTYGGYLAEGARTNLCIAAENFSFGWAAVGTPTRVAAYTACGSVVLDAIGDDTAAALEGYTQTIAFTTTAVGSISLFVHQQSSTSSAFRVRDTSVNADRMLAVLTWAAGAPIVSMTTGTLEGIDALAGNIYRIRMQTDANLNSANVNSLQIYPAADAALNVANTGVLGVGGVQAENNATFCSTYIPTVSSAVARNADVLTYPFITGLDTAGSAYAEGMSLQPSFVANSNMIGFADAQGWPIYGSTGGALTTINAFDGTTGPTKAGLTSMGTASRKRAGSWGSGGMMVTGDGAAPGTSAFDGSMGSTSIAIGCRPAGTNNWFGTLRRVALFAPQFNGSQLQQITS